MENNDALKKAVDTIKKYKAAKEIPASEEEMAGKIGVSPEQFYAYLQGEADAPIDLADRLRSAYDIRTAMVWLRRAFQGSKYRPI
jgi:plasmid maintenance system antidote protein VapI